MRSLIASLKLFAFLILVVIVSITQPIVLLFTRGPKAYVLPWIWYKAVCFVFQIRITTHGTPRNDGQTLFMGNHISYLDIITLGAHIKASYVAKSEVEGWALFGFLSHLQQTAFIERKKTSIARAKDGLQPRIIAGDSFTIFPEGTSTDGREVRAFNSSLFQLAIDSDNPDLRVQPFTISPRLNDGQTLDTEDIRDLYAWHVDSDKELGPHLWRFAKTSGSDVHIIFHPPLAPDAYDNRKALARDCHTAVSSGLLQTPVA